ncbi:16907_t:CDS:2, partial [Dentiscutata heterogama]
MASDKCLVCGEQLRSPSWCISCEAEVFNRQKWSSGSTRIDRMIKSIHARNNGIYLEWIPFEDIDMVEYKTRGPFSIVYSGLWLDGPRQWDETNGDWHRMGPTKCALKRVENFDQMSQEDLNNIIRHSQCFRGSFVVECFGITRNPVDPVGCYMFVMELGEENLYQYIDRVREYICWGEIVEILREIVKGLGRIHENDGLYHGNLHGGNLLIENTSGSVSIKISDIGLHGPINRTAA